METDIDRVTEALPGYEIGDELGHGGWGVVLAGRHRALGRPVAIKQLPPSFASDPAIRKRFASEGRLLASLDHPHVVPVYDFVERDGLCLLVMELLPGGTVWHRFTRTGFNAHGAVAVALACAAGLTAAHSRSILHRDIKPENLLFAESGAVKVTDFGIAKVIGGNDTLATKAGDVLGTPSYIAPEQARGGELSPATDVYALSTMLYELLSGTLPFPSGDDAMATLFMHAFDEPEPLTEVAPGIPQPISDVVMRGLATDPASRYRSAEEFGIALAFASTRRWGPGWLTAEGIPVMGADTIVSATGPGHRQTPTLVEQEGGQPLPKTRPRSDALPASRPSDPDATSPAALESATSAGTRAHSVESPPTVRPSITVHARGAQLAAMSGTDLVPVSSVVQLRSPRIPLLVAGALAVLTVLVAVVGLGQPSTVLPPPGAVSVAGVDPSGGAPVPVDLTAPVAVSVAGSGPEDTATLSIGVLGVPVGDSVAPFVDQVGAGEATFPPIGGEYLVAGALTGTLTLSQAGQVTRTWSFPVRTEQSAIATAMAAVILLVALFAGAYLESFLRSLRRGRHPTTATVGATATAGVLGVVSAGVFWVLISTPLTVMTLVVCAVTAAAAGAAAAIGATRIGRRRRYARVRRLSRSEGPQSQR